MPMWPMPLSWVPTPVQPTTRSSLKVYLFGPMVVPPASPGWMLVRRGVGGVEGEQKGERQYQSVQHGKGLVWLR
jgi:hypothetical protein